MVTIYQTKEFIHNYLRDEYCMNQDKIYEFLNCVSPSFLESVSLYPIFPRKLVKGFVISMIAYGNQKVENCVQDELERSKERKDLWDSL